jgi:hypothetical protein
MIYLSDVSFHWYRTNVNVEACYGCLTGQVKKSEMPKHAGMTNKSISTGMKYWVYYGCPTGQVKKSEIPKRAGTTDKSIGMQDSNQGRQK